MDKLEVPKFWEDGFPGVHGYVVNDHGDRCKSPNWGCGSPYKWPFHGLHLLKLNFIFGGSNFSTGC